MSYSNFDEYLKSIKFNNSDSSNNNINKKEKEYIEALYNDSRHISQGEELSIYFDHDYFLTKQIFPKCIKKCSSLNYIEDTNTFRLNASRKEENTACMINCAYKMEASEKIAISAVKNTDIYKKYVTIPNSKILEEDKLIEKLIEKFY